MSIQIETRTLSLSLRQVYMTAYDQVLRMHQFDALESERRPGAALLMQANDCNDVMANLLHLRIPLERYKRVLRHQRRLCMVRSELR
jgi:hypothetical protein